MPQNLVESIMTMLKKSKVDPENISYLEADQFFAGLASENAELVQEIYPEIENAKLIFDVGANAGYFSKAIFEAGFKGKIVLFEPIRNLHEISKSNLVEYAGQTDFHNTALGDRDGSIELFLPHDSNIGWITAVQSKARTRSTTQAKLTATGPLIEQYRPDFLKIDVEGFESFILEPLSQSLRDDYKPSIFVELGWGVSNPHWDGTVKSLRRLEAHGYCAFDPRGKGREIAIDELVGIRQTVDVLLKAT